MSQSARLESVFGIWLAGLRGGFTALPAEPTMALKRFVLPVTYWRAAEFSFACRQLVLPSGSRVLDVGSPKDLSAFLARYRRFEVVATDILPVAVDRSHRFARAQHIDGVGPGKVVSEVCDGRDLPYPDHSFDAAFSISVLEHIPDSGDSQAIAELVRVVKPGGTVVVTVPFSEATYDTFVERTVFERQQSEPGCKVFFERHYDEGTLQSRLIQPSGADIAVREYWGERSVRVGDFLDRHEWLRIPFFPFEVFLSKLYLSKIDEGMGGHRMAAFLSLKKPIAKRNL